MKAFNAAATYVAKVAFEEGTFNQQSIHKRCYYVDKQLRERFSLRTEDGNSKTP